MGTEALKLISCCLREPLGVTRGILRNNLAYLDMIEYRRNTVLTEGILEQQRDSLHLLEAERFAELVSEHRQARLYVSFHFGDFVYGLNYLMSLEAPGRERLVYSAKPGSAACFENIRRCFGNRAPGPESQLLASDTDTLGLARRLRGSRTSLLLFADLPRAYGATVAINFLGRRARFPRGPALLGMSARLPLTPVISYFSGKNNCLEVGESIDTLPRLDESREQTVARITQSLLDYLQLFLLRYPEQWRYLQLLPGYFLEETATPDPGSRLSWHHSPNLNPIPNHGDAP